jgi:sec-independent protein translocase protein TatC
MPTAVDERNVKKLDYASKAGKNGNGKGHFDPDSYRMTIGEHLEELRTRMVLGIIGFTLAAVVCFIFGERVVWWFCRPLMQALAANGFSPQVYMHEVSESFMVYIKISMITAAAFASPWMVYQLWQFVAAGLYPHERKYITKYLPLSITLLITGMVFLYVVVLPLMLRFFVAFSIGLPITIPKSTDLTAGNLKVTVPVLNGDPAALTPGTMYYDASQGRLKFVIGTTEHPEVRVIPYGSSDIVTPQITLEAYIDMVVNMLLSFGVAFQMPLVVLTLVRIGIVDVPTLKSWRRYVYFGTSIIAAVIVPDVVGGMVALMIPLILLFELGLWLARERTVGTTGNWFKDTWLALRKGALGGKLLSYAGTALLIGLIIHAMIRNHSQQPPAAGQAGQNQPAAKPTSAPSSQPATLPATQPTTTPTTQPDPR